MVNLFISIKMPTLNATKIGIITGVCLILLQLFFFIVIKLPVESPAKYFIYFVYAAGITWSLLHFNKSFQVSSTGIKVFFSTGFKTFIVATLFVVVYTFIFYKLHPEISQAIINSNSQLLKLQGNHTPKEISDNAAQLNHIFIPMIVSITTLLYLFFGAIFTLLISVIILQTKKK